MKQLKSVGIAVTFLVSAAHSQITSLPEKGAIKTQIDTVAEDGSWIVEAVYGGSGACRLTSYQNDFRFHLIVGEYGARFFIEHETLFDFPEGSEGTVSITFNQRWHPLNSEGEGNELSTVINGSEQLFMTKDIRNI